MRKDDERKLPLNISYSARTPLTRPLAPRARITGFLGLRYFGRFGRTFSLVAKHFGTPTDLKFAFFKDAIKP